MEARSRAVGLSVCYEAIQTDIVRAQANRNRDMHLTVKSSPHDTNVDLPAGGHQINPHPTVVRFFSFTRKKNKIIELQIPFELNKPTWCPIVHILISNHILSASVLHESIRHFVTETKRNK